MMYAIAVVYGIYWDWFDKNVPVVLSRTCTTAKSKFKKTDDNALCYMKYLDKAILMSEHLICLLLLFLSLIIVRSHLTWHNYICIALTTVISLTN